MKSRYNNLKSIILRKFILHWTNMYHIKIFWFFHAKLYQRNLSRNFLFKLHFNDNSYKINFVPLISYLNHCAHSLLIKLSMRMKECFLSLVGENNFDEIQTWLSPYILNKVARNTVLKATFHRNAFWQ